MTSEFIPYGKQSINDDDVRAVTAALTSDWLTTGPAVDRFEADLTRYVGAPTVVVSSGTAALHTAYAAVGVGRGRDIVTTPMTFVATAAVAAQLGASVDFVDISDETLAMNTQATAAVIKDSTAALVPVDYGGWPTDIPSLVDLASSVGAVVVEDAAHSIGASYEGRPVGSIAHLTTFSFHPVKTITTAEGGAVAVADERFMDRVRRFRSHGMVREPGLLRRPDGGWHQEVHQFGLNYRLPDVLAALGASQLERIGSFLERRRRIADKYLRGLAGIDGLRLPTPPDAAEPAWHLFPVRVQDGRRRFVYDYMRERNIGVQVHYLPAHLHPVFEDLGYRKGMCPVAENAYEELISLPIFPDLGAHDQDRVMSTLVAALRV